MKNEYNNEFFSRDAGPLNHNIHRIFAPINQPQFKMLLTQGKGDKGKEDRYTVFKK